MSWKRPGLLALFIASMACWLERQAASQIEYLKAENRALRARLGRRRILFSNAERRTLGSLAKEVGRKALRDLDPIVCPANSCAGIGSSWRGNGRFSTIASRADRVQNPTSSSSLCVWRARIRAEAIPASKARYSI
jgi:hypothetical protein